MTPLLFMGQEWGASTPFLFFTDHSEDLGRKVTEGRRKEFAHFDGFSDEKKRSKIPDPQDIRTFERSRLDWAERNAPERDKVLAVHREMLRLRASDPVLRGGGREELRAQAEDDMLVVERWLGDEIRRLFVNFGAQSRTPRPEGIDEPRVLIATKDA